MRLPIAIAAVVMVAGCEMPPISVADALSMSDTAICRRIEATRTYNPTSADIDVLLAEFSRRNPKVPKSELEDIRGGLVGPGMSETAAICSWVAEKVGQTSGYGRSTSQYKGEGSYSYFFVNNRTGRVEYISS